MVIDRLTDEIRQESHWTTMFMSGLVIAARGDNRWKINLVIWRDAQEKRGMKVSRSKTDYTCVNKGVDGGEVRMQALE